MDHLPERPSQPREPSRRDLGLKSFVGFENHSQPETDDAFQAWLLNLFDCEIDGICDPSTHSSPQISNLLDKEESIPVWKSQTGNFSRSSRGISVDSAGNLQAQCQMLNGEYSFSVMSLKSIIMGLNGKFHWLDGTMRSPGCQISDAIDFCCLRRLRSRHFGLGYGHGCRGEILAIQRISCWRVSLPIIMWWARCARGLSVGRCGGPVVKVIHGQATRERRIC